MSKPNPGEAGISYRQILATWWPLAFSWLLMSVEIPAISAVIARLANPEIHLAAYGSVVYPLALIIEAPVIMLLGASVALSRHQQAYRRVWTYMMVSGAVLTLLHFVFALTPLYYWVVRDWMRVPSEVVEPARIGMILMLPWTWAIGYRRFQQGVLIRYGYSGAVGVGTVIRLLTGGAALAVGYWIHSLPGVVVGSAAQALAVTAEAVYAGWRVRPVLRGELRRAPVDEPLTWRGFADFYIPLALTSFISMLWQPMGSAALSRMPSALNSLAVWPVVTGLTFILRSLGVAYNEAVVALLHRPGSWPNLRRFTWWMALGVSALQVLLNVTPLAWLYFTGFSALSAELARLATAAFWLMLPMPALAVFQNWFQGTILHGRRTRGVPESVAVFLVTALVVLGAGVMVGRWAGLYISTTAVVLANITQMAWLWFRSRPVMDGLRQRDGAPAAQTI